MKFLLKIALVVFMVSLLSAFSVAYAQVITGDNTVSPTGSNLNSVCIVSNTTTVTNATLLNSDAWAVGDSGTIIRWNGTRWSTVNSSTSTNLYSIVMVNSTSGWAVGGGANNGIILRYNGTWSVWNMTNQLNSTLYAVTADGTGATGWTVGANGATVYWNGNQWTIQANTTKNALRSVAMIRGANDAWVVGDNGTILHYNGSSWSNMTSPTSTNLNSIVIVNASVGWAAGGGSNNGTLLNMNGTTWSVWNRINFGGAVNATAGYVTDTINATLYSLTMDTANSAWASGAKGTVLYWTGTEWDGQANIVTNTLKGIAMVHGAPAGSSYAWAVGDGGKILAWTGTSWIPEIPIVMVAPVLMSIAALAALLGKSKLSKRIKI
ncbi:hypothetical protein IMZ68_03595 [Candidatus Bathyarchaeota archaeon]|nr:hypothetical protein [Candidatus Bathyarchaeota archaeon]